MQASARRLRRLVLAFLLPVLSLGCSQSTSPPNDMGERVSFDRLQSFFPTTYSGITAGEDTVIRNPEDWNGFWARFRTGSQPATPPDVDFQAEMVLVAAMGTRNTAGYAVEIVRVLALEDGSLSVLIRETTPGDDCSTAQVLTQPVDAVLVRRSDAPVHFSAESEVHRCGEDGGSGGRGY